MQNKGTIASLMVVRNELLRLLALEKHDKFMCMRLKLSITIINKMIAARAAGKKIGKNICQARHQKSR